MNDQRLIDLETKFSFQENILEELQRDLHSQFQKIEKLEKSLKIITDHLKASNDSLNSAHEKPPHY